MMARLHQSRDDRDIVDSDLAETSETGERRCVRACLGEGEFGIHSESKTMSKMKKKKSRTGATCRLSGNLEMK